MAFWEVSSHALIWIEKLFILDYIYGKALGLFAYKAKEKYLVV